MTLTPQRAAAQATSGCLGRVPLLRPPPAPYLSSPRAVSRDVSARRRVNALSAPLADKALVPHTQLQQTRLPLQPPPLAAQTAVSRGNNNNKNGKCNCNCSQTKLARNASSDANVSVDFVWVLYAFRFALVFVIVVAVAVIMLNAFCFC